MLPTLRQRYVPPVASRRALLFAAAAVMAAGCAAPPTAHPGGAQAPVGYDLAAELPHAEVEAEDPVLVIGAPATRRRLIRGWSESAADGVDPVWSLGPVSFVDLFVGRVRDLTLELRCEPFRGVPGPSFEIRVNGAAVGTVSMQPGVKTYAVAVPARLLVFGDNRFEFRYSSTREPAQEKGSTDRRDLAVSWHSIAFVRAAGTATGSGHASVSAESGGLRIASGSRVSYFMGLDSGARLTYSSLAVEGASDCALELVAEGALAGRRVAITLRPSSEPATVPVNLGPDAFARLSLSAVCSDRQAGRGATFTLVHPVLQADASEGTAVPVPVSGGRGQEHPSVFVYLVDTLRRDHVGCYGYPRPVTPHIDAFRKEAILFQNAHSHTSWTRPAVASLMTGLPPRVHGATHWDDALAPGARTLAEILGAAGYRTAAAVANGHVSASFGFSRGFEQFVETDATPATDINRHAFRWLDTIGASSPLFMYVHIIDPHDPYSPPPPYRRRFASDVHSPDIGSVEQLAALRGAHDPVSPDIRRQLVDLYDGEIAAADAAFGDFLDGLRARGLYDDALIVFCADHGEELYDHGSWLHGGTLYEEVVAVPLVVKLPHGRLGGTTRERLVQQADVFVSILAETGAGIADPSRWARDVFGPRVGGERCIFHSLDIDTHRTSGIQCGDWKLVREEGEQARAELYNLREDPSEAHDRLEAEPERARLLLALLRARMRSNESVALPRVKVELDPDLRERLRALGYLD